MRPVRQKTIKISKNMTLDELQDQELVKYLDEVGETQDSDLACGYIDGWDAAQRIIIDKACQWLRDHLGAPAGIPQAKSYNDAINELTTEFRKGMEG